MRIYSALLLIAVSGCAGENGLQADSTAGVSRSEPVFEVEMWPGEGIPVIEAVRENLTLIQAPRVGAPVTGRLTVTPGQQLAYDSTRYQTLKGVPLQVRAATTVKGRVIGAVRFLSTSDYYSGAYRDTVIAVAPAAPVELLQYRAEGTCFVRIGADVVDAETCPTFDAVSFVTAGEPRILWWIHVRTPAASGWLLLGDSTAHSVRRTF